MKKKKIIQIISFLAALSLILSACGGGGSGNGGTSSGNSGASGAKGEQIQLTFSHYYLEEERPTSAEMDSYMTLVEEWEANNPNVNLVQSVMSQADYSTKIQAQAAVNEIPDIFFLKGSWVSNFANNDLLMPINDYLDQYEHKDKFRKGVFDAATRDGNIYGIPNQLSITSVVFYNEQMWKEIGYDRFPDNWEDIYKAAEKFNEKGISAIALGNKDKWPAESSILSTMGDRFTGTDWTNSIIARDGSAKFTDPEFVSALDQMQSIAANKVFNPDFNIISNAQAEEYYAQGKAAATIDGHWALSYLLSNASEEVLSQTKVAILPPVDGGKGDNNTISGGAGWYVALNKNLEGAKLDAAMDFLFSTAGYDFSRVYAEKYGMTGPSLIEGTDLTQFPQLTQDFAALTGSLTFTPIYDMLMEGSIIESMNTGLQEVLNGTKTGQELAAQLQSGQDSL
ncbi:extracellular solute-binding protein [Paenibacillus ihumii]|uniref:extracellular solute-binding protein n=1 Tax=Paenibacillus ihumii TaxID=687436 RepID=UPI0006D76688|nr:extracellular solute-binding protein [Paenibacillus ihumii]